MTHIKSTWIVLLLGVIALLGWKASSFGENENPPGESDINIEDYTWLVGHWKGDGFGGTSEEIWAPPVNGTMMGMYRHVDADGALTFYEFMLLDKNGLRLKHFHPDLRGWESKDDFMTFPMVEYDADKIALKGLIFERKSDEAMEIRLRLKRGDVVETEVFTMTRVE